MTMCKIKKKKGCAAGRVGEMEEEEEEEEKKMRIEAWHGLAGDGRDFEWDGWMGVGG